MRKGNVEIQPADTLGHGLLTKRMRLLNGKCGAYVSQLDGTNLVASGTRQNPTILCVAIALATGQECYAAGILECVARRRIRLMYDMEGRPQMIVEGPDDRGGPI